MVNRMPKWTEFIVIKLAAIATTAAATPEPEAVEFDAVDIGGDIYHSCT